MSVTTNPYGTYSWAHSTKLANRKQSRQPSMVEKLPYMCMESADASLLWLNQQDWLLK